MKKGRDILLGVLIDWLALTVLSGLIVGVTFYLVVGFLDFAWLAIYTQSIAIGLAAVRFLIRQTFSIPQVQWLWRFWQPHLGWLWMLAFLTLLSSGVTLVFPMVFRYVIDFLESSLAEAAPEAANSVTWKAIWIFAAIGFARSLAHFYPSFRAMINAKLGMDVREHYFSRILEKGHAFFQKFRTGDLVTRLTDDIEGFPKIAWFSCSGVFRALESLSKFLFCMGFMLYMNWKLSLLSLIPLPIMFTLFYFIRTAISKASLELQQMISKTNDSLEAAFSGVRIVKAFRAETNQATEFRRILDDRIVTELRLMRLWFGLMNVFQWMQLLGQVIVMIAGGMMVIKGTLTIGELYAFYIYLSLLLGPLMNIPQLFVASRQAFACIDREVEIENTPGGTEGIYTGKQPVQALDLVELADVDFRYEKELPLALDGIDLRLKRGEKAAVVGSVGSGKSTLIKIVAGLMPPVDGKARVNGQDLKLCDINDYRARIGYIPQESTLFSESVADNVAFGRSIDRDRVIESLDMAQVKEEMEALPNGIEEVLGQKGLTVSGGQKQRLAIARALAGNPDLLLMDDCTSALDAENERRFWEMFSDRFPDTACLIVTHRLATARKADMIYVLHEGKIVGRGTHEKLLETCEEYRNFLTREELQAALRLNRPKSGT